MYVVVCLLNYVCFNKLIYFVYLRLLFIIPYALVSVPTYEVYTVA